MTRSTIAVTDRHVIRSNSATVEPDACAANHAQVSSKLFVNLDPAPHGTAATTTP